MTENIAWIMLLSCLPGAIITLIFGVRFASGDLRYVSGFDVTQVKDKAAFARIIARLMFVTCGFLVLLGVSEFLPLVGMVPVILILVATHLVVLIWHLLQLRRLQSGAHRP